MRSLLAAATLLFLPVALVHAQALPSSQFGERLAARIPQALERTALEAPQSPPQAAPVIPQLVAGFVGLTAGAAAGILVTGGAVRAEDRDERILLGALGGAIVGTVAGVHWYGKRHGLRSNVMVTALGATAGMLLIYAAPVTMPIGATVAYNLARRER